MKLKSWVCLILAILTVMACFAGCAAEKNDGDASADTISKMSDLSGKKIGIMTGSVQAVLLPKMIPDAQYSEFNSRTDQIAALQSGRIDAFSTDESIYKAMLWEGMNFARVDEAVMLSDYGWIFGKGKNTELQSKVNQYLQKIKDDGTHDALQKKWFGDKEPTEFLTCDGLEATNGTLKIAICSTSKPFVYMKDGKFVGFEIEILIGFCKEYGYNVEFEDSVFAGVIAGVSAGKCDIGMCGITITDERKESVDFSMPSRTEDLVIVVRASGKEKTKISDLATKRIGIVTGSLFAVTMPKALPDATFYEYYTYTDIIAALESGKLDAFPTDESIYKAMLWEGSKVSRIDESIDVSEYGLVFKKGGNLTLQKQINDYLAKTKQDGSHKALEEKWFADKEPTEFLSYEGLPATNGTLKIGICSSSKPFVYKKNDAFAGFDIEFLTSFAKEYGYALDFDDCAFANIMAGIEVGKYDIGVSGITITDERRESVDFSDVYHTEDLVFVIRNLEAADDLTQFNNAALGVVTGSLYGGYSKEQFPNAAIKEFNTFADVLVALKQGRVDGIMLDKPNFNSVARTDDKLSSITVPAYSVEIGFGFQKNEEGYALQAQMNEFLAKLKSEGKIDAMIDKWYGETEPNEKIPLEELASNETVLDVAIDTTRKPFVYMYEGKPVGFEIEVLYMFCKEYGYNVKTSDISFASGLAGLASEKYDMVCGGLYMTDERKESVNFSEPYMFADVVMAKYERGEFESFLMSLQESFDKTFVREQRWKLIVEGIINTLTISVFAVLGGTLLGFALYMLTRSKTKWLARLGKIVAKIYCTIIAGTPTLVVLMLLFYVVLTAPGISGVMVAIVGFILTFGSFVYENLALTVSGVDNGQLEAAYALGYSRNRAFFRIILPQAMKMFLPNYSGEIVTLIKATSIVGYIAVNDLTKMGDIIRGNTYEAFFPLIAVAIIYFAITWGIAGLLGILRKKADPKRRKNKNILKGVER